ncbi:corrinoid ABC transporter substrate-binding protein [Stieleria maiorica]|uniref:Corrinoid ABC transporter substrate-binding protein n=1 Tax=Stieleria maiorica TaxID=2795974 RepID=A0A5B9MGF4_9BACT|nr:cobalamin-binding protein [Stieleria maiorica]QEF99186.1 corrinoid ABC transporter substrate-binding protein [Stieleria maiorica]
MRIVSLLPSATEIICAIGLRDQLVGVSHECDYPASVSELPKVTRTIIPDDVSSGQIDALVREQVRTQQALYRLDVPLVRSLEPDLIVTQALCNVCAVSKHDVDQALCSLANRAQVINLEPTCLGDVFDCIGRVAAAAGCESDGATCVDRLKTRVQAVADRSQNIRRQPAVMLLEWIDPPFSAGHWNPELVALAGGRPVIGAAGERSQSVDWDRVVQADPDVIFIACCGFDVRRTLDDLPRLQSYPHWRTLRCVRAGRVYVVDGSAYFNRPGPRLVDSLEILSHTLHPEVHPRDGGLPEASRVLPIAGRADG